MINTYKTGTTIHGANNLILTVLNDGASYDARKHAGFAMLQGINPTYGFKELIADQVKTLRISGDKFTARDIKEARELIIKDTLQHCLELIKDSYTNGPITATIRRWWDNVNGNSYFSVNVNIGKHTFNLPFQYGYDSQPNAETEAVLNLIGISAANVEYVDQGFKLKRDMFTGVYINKMLLA